MSATEASSTGVAPLQQEILSPTISRRGLLAIFLSYNAIAGASGAAGHELHDDAQALENSIQAQAISAGSQEGSPQTQDAAVLATSTELKAKLQDDIRSERRNGTLAYGLSGVMLVGEAVYFGAKAVLRFRTRQNSNL